MLRSRGMGSPDIILVNPNILRPPIAPVGLDYIAGYLEQNGFEARILDLNPLPEKDVLPAVKNCFSGNAPLAVGISVRNIDDSTFPSARIILEDTKKIVAAVRAATDAPIILGGVGFSIMPRDVLAFLRADFGIAGDGEEPLRRFLAAKKNGTDAAGIPGLVRRSGGRKARCAPACLDVPRRLTRSFISNSWYFQNGAQVGVETKRGCTGTCVFCADPLAKGRACRLREPSDVADELAQLAGMGVGCVHFCDSEFNRPLPHAMAVCGEIIRAGLNKKMMFYAYGSPLPFSGDLAEKMAEAGFAGMDFGVDHLDSGILKRLGRDHREKDVRNATRWLKENGIAVMHDLLLGSPGETEKTLADAIEKSRASEADYIGVSCGVRVYQGTALQKSLRKKDDRFLFSSKKGDFLFPLYHVSPLGRETVELVCRLIGDDRRFFYQPLGEKHNYNYAGNDSLAKAIRNGARGAYWHILGNMG